MILTLPKKLPRDTAPRQTRGATTSSYCLTKQALAEQMASAAVDAFRDMPDPEEFPRTFLAVARLTMSTLDPIGRSSIRCSSASLPRLT